MSPTQFGGPMAWSMRWCFRQADATTCARCLGDAYTGRLKALPHTSSISRDIEQKHNLGVPISSLLDRLEDICSSCKPSTRFGIHYSSRDNDTTRR